jgi:hypothetical protein
MVQSYELKATGKSMEVIPVHAMKAQVQGIQI